MIRTIESILIPLLLSVVAAEVTVRLAGISPVPQPPAVASESLLYIEDQQLGWYNRPRIKQAVVTTVGRPHTITSLENGARATSNSPTSRRNDIRRDVIFIGCSFTHGFGLNDDETYAWKVQAARPDWNVHNFGVNGYGTCQAYMLLKRFFERDKWHKPVVIYGFIDDHEDRNVADYNWHYELSRLSSTGNASLPSCMLDSSGSVVFNALRPYPQFPLRHTLATISVLETVYLKFAGASLAGQKRPITEQLLIEMEAFVRAQSGQLGVLLFDAGGRSSRYREFLERRKIRVVNLNRSGRNIAGPLTQSDGHPNGKMADLIAASVVEFVDSLGG
jgi:hypothetical protein